MNWPTDSLLSKPDWRGHATGIFCDPPNILTQFHPILIYLQKGKTELQMDRLADLSSQQRKKDEHTVGQIVRQAGSFRRVEKIAEMKKSRQRQTEIKCNGSLLTSLPVINNLLSFETF